MGTTHEVVIVGTGFAGIGMAIRLKKAGIDEFVVLERASGVGGVWRDNTYPGVACDVESHLYSFSFEPNPGWSRTFSGQAEILAYIRHCVEKYDLARHIRFDAAVTSAVFDEDRGVWTVTTGSGDVHEGRLLVSGSGHALSKPVYPDIEGRETFRGKSFHTGRWDHGSPLDGKRVAVIGTGASAIQVIPNVAAVAGKLHVFQRTAPWVLPKSDRPIGPRERARHERSPWTQRLKRLGIYWRNEVVAFAMTREPKWMKLGERVAVTYLRETVKDDALRRKLRPKFTMGCKRVLLSNDYYPALTRSNVEVVTDGISRITPEGILTNDGTVREVDVLVFATGFEASEASAPFDVHGTGGVSLATAWRNGIEAYLGCTVSGFPNFFMLAGPNTGLGHTSMIFMIESQLNYVMDCIAVMKRRRLRSVDVKRDVQSRYNASIQEKLAGTVWATGCQSWYLTGSGKNTVVWPGFTFEFRLRTLRFDVDHYDTVKRDAATSRATTSSAVSETLGVASNGAATNGVLLDPS